MTESQKRYRAFLRTDFWKNLTELKKRAIGYKCEECGGVENLCSHHLFYREDWYETKLDDLKVLCSTCHRREHGFVVGPYWEMMIHREDLQFSRFLFWFGKLTDKMFHTGRTLNRREEWYAEQALKMYPPTKKDACMKFRVEQLFKNNKLAPLCV